MSVRDEIEKEATRLMSEFNPAELCAENERLQARVKALDAEVGATLNRLQEAHEERDALAARVKELEAQLSHEAYHHAACLSIAEGVPGWQEFKPEFAAAKAVGKLRTERDALAAKLALEQKARQNVSELFHKGQEFRRNYGKGESMEIAKRILDTCDRLFGKTGMGVIEQHIACEVKAYGDALEAKLADSEARAKDYYRQAFPRCVDNDHCRSRREHGDGGCGCHHDSLGMAAAGIKPTGSRLYTQTQYAKLEAKLAVAVEAITEHKAKNDSGDWVTGSDRHYVNAELWAALAKLGAMP